MARKQATDFSAEAPVAEAPDYQAKFQAANQQLRSLKDRIVEVVGSGDLGKLHQIAADMVIENDEDLGLVDEEEEQAPEA